MPDEWPPMKGTVGWKDGRRWRRTATSASNTAKSYCDELRKSGNRLMAYKITEKLTS